MYRPFHSESRSKRIPSKFPYEDPTERDTCLQGIFTSHLVYLFNISFGVTSKGVLPPGPPHGIPWQRDVPFLEPSFIYYLKSPIHEPPPFWFQVPLGHKGAPTERYVLTGHFYISFDIVYFFNISFGVTSKGVLPPGPPSWNPLAER
jgi:hypothetical protein